MPFEIQGSDILTFSGDAIVNPTDAFLSGSDGLDAQIHKAAGLFFRLECNFRKTIRAGETVITHAGQLMCRYVIHTVVPVWTGATGEEKQLRACYRSALAIVEQHGLEEVAFPLLGCGERGFPKVLALRIAVEEISAYLSTHEDTYILLAIHDRSIFQPDPVLLDVLKTYIHVIKWQ